VVNRDAGGRVGLRTSGDAYGVWRRLFRRHRPARTTPAERHGRAVSAAGEAARAVEWFLRAHHVISPEAGR
jgi:hypothetical protein